MDHKKYQEDENTGCISCLMCCNLPASAAVKILSIFSILFGLGYCCLGVWMLIVTSSNSDLPKKQQLIYETWSEPSESIQLPPQQPQIQQGMDIMGGGIVMIGDPSNEALVGGNSHMMPTPIQSPKKMVPLTTYYNYLIALGVLSLSVGFVRTLSSIFLLWNSVEKHSILPGKVWILLTMMGTTTIVTYLVVALNVTGFISDTPWSPVRVQNDKYSFYILLTIFRIICFCDIFLTLYFVFIVLWFVRTRN